MKLITRKEMVTRIIEDQIKRGVIKEEDKDFQINARLKGQFAEGWNSLYDYCKRYNLLKEGE